MSHPIACDCGCNGVDVAMKPQQPKAAPTPTNNIDNIDELLIKIIENYTNALNKISVEQMDEKSWSEHYKYIQEETARAIQQHYAPKAAINKTIMEAGARARISELKQLEPPKQYEEYAKLIGSEYCSICGFNAVEFRKHIKNRIAELKKYGRADDE